MTKKKSVFLRSALMLLVLAMVGATLFAGNTTLARYRAVATGQATNVEVAAFDVQINGIGMVDGMTEFNQANLNTALNLFSTIREWRTPTAFTGQDAAGAVDTHVRQNAAGTENTHIAPGTMGWLDLIVTNLSDVSVEIDAAVALQAGATAMQQAILDRLTISVHNITAVVGGATAINADWSLLPAAMATNPILSWDDTGAANVATLRIVWEWPFMDGSACACGLTGCEGGYAVDTPIGFAANAAGGLELPVIATVIASQVD